MSQLKIYKLRYYNEITYTVFISIYNATALVLVMCLNIVVAAVGVVNVAVGIMNQQTWSISTYQ